MKETTDISLSKKLANFLERNRKTFIIILGAFVVAIIAVIYISYSYSQKNIKVMSQIRAIEEAEGKLSGDSISLEDFIKITEEAASNYPGSQAELKGITALASYYFDEEDFKKSYDLYLKAYTDFPENFTASVNMFNAAMALEELGRDIDAIETLEALVAKYKVTDVQGGDNSGDVPEALFNLARLYEKSGNKDKAIENYEVIVAEYQSYNLSNLAKTRLIQLK